MLLFVFLLLGFKSYSINKFSGTFIGFVANISISRDISIDEFMDRFDSIKSSKINRQSYKLSKWDFDSVFSGNFDSEKYIDSKRAINTLRNDLVFARAGTRPLIGLNIDSNFLLNKDMFINLNFRFLNIIGFLSSVITFGHNYYGVGDYSDVLRPIVSTTYAFIPDASARICFLINDTTSFGFGFSLAACPAFLLGVTAGYDWMIDDNFKIGLAFNCHFHFGWSSRSISLFDLDLGNMLGIDLTFSYRVKNMIK